MRSRAMSVRGGMSIRTGALGGRRMTVLPVHAMQFGDPSTDGATAPSLLSLPGLLSLPTLIGLPGLPGGGATTTGIQIGFEQRNGLWIVASLAEPLIARLLTTMAFNPATPDSTAGVISAFVGTPAPPAVSAATFVNSQNSTGSAVLVEMASVQTGVLNVIAVHDAATIASAASGASGKWALINDQPTALVGAAAALVAGGKVQPGQQPLPTIVPDQPSPSPGTPTVVPAPAVGLTAQPWFKPAAIGFGALVLIGVVVVATRKKT